MRKIEFKAWCNELGMSDIFKLGAYPQWSGKNDERKISKPYWSELCQILQYTGIKDRDGKKIFEGDIVELIGSEVCAALEINTRGLIVFKDARFFVENGQCDLEFQRPSEGEKWIRLGDKFGNPELLKERR